MTAWSRLWSRLTGDYVALGDAYARSGQLRRAASMYARAGNYSQAAEACVRAGLISEAVAFYERAGTHQAAADLLVREGRHKEAVVFYQRAESHWAAAEAALKANQVLRAARLFEQARDLERAAECFERAGEPEDALRVLEAQSKNSARPLQADARRKVDLRRARLLAKLGRRAEAAELLKSIGEPLKAADLWLRSGEKSKAAESFLEAGQPQRAVPLIDDSAIAPELRARVLGATSDHRGAAELYLELEEWGRAAEELEAAGDYEAAAKVHEEHGDLVVAAELFAREGLFEDAGRCYSSGGSGRAAADAYSQAGQHRRAAGCYLQADEPVAAARELIRAQDHDSAIKALRNLPAGDSRYEDATLLLAPLLVATGEGTEALERLDAIPGEPSSATRRLERSYWRGRALEARGQLEAARQAFENVVSERSDHRDARQRVQVLGERLREGAVASKEQKYAAAGELLPGQVLADRYEVDREIGRGGMSRVYRAADRELGEPVAIKVLFPRPWDTSNAEERLLNEVQICRRIAHPNVVRVFDFGRFQGGLFITMELLEGMTLNVLLREQGRLPVVRVKALLDDVLQGLAEAHRLRIVHRDLKPGNVAVTPSRAKIMDFGIARLQDVDSNLTQTGQVIGSPMYMSPEQVQGLDLDPRSDLYSVGVMTFTLLVGREPFRGRTPTAISLKHLRKQPPDLLELRPDLHPDWGTLVARLMRKRREDRYESAEEVLALLRELPV